MANNHINESKNGASPQPALKVDGTITRETVEILAASSSRAAVEKTLDQVIQFMGKVIAQYEKDVSPGEVGASGSGMASNSEALEQCPTGLLYGRIQSGKTQAMVLSSALALDNGFKVVIILTSDNVKLVEQTSERFAVLPGVIQHSSTQMNQMEQDIEHAREEVRRHGLIVICQKNGRHLQKLNELLQAIDANKYPGIVFDDEADQATLDTNLRRRSANIAAGGPGNISPSTIHRRTIENEEHDEVGMSIRQVLRHNVFVQVTATPYSILLQNSNSPLRPQFTHLLEPGDGYTGGEHFFSPDMVDNESPPLIFVDDNESSILSGMTSASLDAPLGLKRALAYFTVASACQRLDNPASATTAHNFLCHTSMRRGAHELARDYINAFVRQMSDELRSSETGSETRAHLNWAYEELLKTHPSAPALVKILELASSRLLPFRKISVINSEGDTLEFRPGLNFLIGGNILGRGLTLENLLVTYYVRRSQTSQMDTMYQHARMFGYRKRIMHYTRVFLSEALAVRFQGIHSSETNLRDFVNRNRTGSIPVQIIGGLRPTRAGVLDGSNVSAILPGQQIYPYFAPKITPSRTREVAEKYSRLLENTVKGVTQKPGYHKITIDQLKELVRSIPVTEDEPGAWNADTLISALDSVSEQFGNQAYVSCRDMSRTKLRFATGAASGEERDEARTMDGPVLFLFKEKGNKNGGFEFWYPTLVFPSQMPTLMINSTSLEGNDD